MAYTTIDDPSAYFHVNLHNGNGTNNTDITFDANAGDFQPDWIWFKGRTSSAIDHALFDSSRGTTKILNSNNTNAENAQGATLKVFNSNGFRVGDDAGDYGVNASGRTYVTWNWKANGGTTASNSDGSITSTVQANTTAGFSIVTYTGNGSSGATIGHGLGAVPSMFIIKRRSGTEDWVVYHHKNTSAPETDHLLLNTTDATSDSDTRFNDTAPTSSLITMGNNAVINASGSTYVCYAFAEKQGYSKFGSYTGNGNANGTFVYTGFKPAWILFKATTGTENWGIFDNRRNTQTGNPRDIYLMPSANNADSAESDSVDFLSNGFKWRIDSGFRNGNGVNFIYMAFAESPFVSSEGVPTTAG